MHVMEYERTKRPSNLVGPRESEDDHLMLGDEEEDRDPMLDYQKLSYDRRRSSTN